MAGGDDGDKKPSSSPFTDLAIKVGELSGLQKGLLDTQNRQAEALNRLADQTDQKFLQQMELMQHLHRENQDLIRKVMEDSHKAIQGVSETTGESIQKVTDIVEDHKQDDNYNFTEIRKLVWKIIYISTGVSLAVAAVWAALTFLVSNKLIGYRNQQPPQTWREYDKRMDNPAH